MRPFLKWAGNKYSVREEILPILGKPGSRYVEPFLGSGAMYFSIGMLYDQHWLNDKNQDVINLFFYLAKTPQTLLTLAKGFFTPSYNTPAGYEANRDAFNNLDRGSRFSSCYRAALFLYLNRHCFNGLTRYNKKGDFNVPFGRYRKPKLPDWELRNCSLTLQRDKPCLTSEDFEDVLCMTGEGDVVYCDPPYFPTSATSNFTGYTNGWKTGKDDTRLAYAARAAFERGAHVVISNSNTDFIRSIYGLGVGRAQSIEIQANRSIAAKGGSRGKQTELLIWFEK